MVLPYHKGLTYLGVHCMCMLVDLLFVKVLIICRLATSGIRAFSMAKCGIFFSPFKKHLRENWAANFRSVSKTLCVDLEEINCRYEFLSQKYVIKKNISFGV